MCHLSICRLTSQCDSRAVLLDGGAEASLFHNEDLLSDFTAVSAAKLKTFMTGEGLSVAQAASFYGVRVFVWFTSYQSETYRTTPGALSSTLQSTDPSRQQMTRRYLKHLPKQLTFNLPLHNL
jgi:hypothetical protein